MEQCKQSEWISLKQEIVIPEIMSFLKNLAANDYFNFFSNGMEMICYDYMWEIYMQDNMFEESREYFNDFYLSLLFQRTSIEDLANEFFLNESYMYSILDYYFSIKMREIPFLPRQITDEKVISYMQESKPSMYTKIKEFL